MSHTHFCDVAGHPWQCESDECICICQKQIEQGDHSRCPIKLSACPEHSDEQFSVAHRDGHANADASCPPATRTEQEGCRGLQPIPPEIEEKLDQWFASERTSIGFCCLCGKPIPTESDFIPFTYTHDCVAGRLFEEQSHRGRDK